MRFMCSSKSPPECIRYHNAISEIPRIPLVGSRSYDRTSLRTLDRSFATQYLGWRWTYWLVMIFTAFAWVVCSSIEETYAPVILRKRAEKMRQDIGDKR